MTPTLQPGFPLHWVLGGDTVSPAAGARNFTSPQRPIYRAPRVQPAPSLAAPAAAHFILE